MISSILTDRSITAALGTVIYVTAVASFVMLVSLVIYGVIRFMRRDPLQVRYGDEKKRTRNGMVLFSVLLIFTILTSAYVFVFM